MLLQILDKVSPNPAEAKAVTARKNRKKNRFDQFLPGMYHLNHSSASCIAQTHDYSHSLLQLTGGVCNSREKTRIIYSPLQSTLVNTLLHVSVGVVWTFTPLLILVVLSLLLFFFLFFMLFLPQGYKQHRAFIIAQGPMESTAKDFWKMVHDKKCGVIVMLSDLVEGGQVRGGGMEERKRRGRTYRTVGV